MSFVKDSRSSLDDSDVLIIFCIVRNEVSNFIQLGLSSELFIPEDFFVTCSNVGSNTDSSAQRNRENLAIIFFVMNHPDTKFFLFL